jgi:flagellar biosynthesis/type III secretory pathway M-ring protein FliF/YscJ
MSYLLQFTALDLASIAQKLDAMEQSYDENNQGKSTNMDDSGQSQCRMTVASLTWDPTQASSQFKY